MIFKEILDKSQLQHSFDIRRKVFIEEQNVSESEEFDELDKVCRHFLLWLDEKPIGTCRLRTTPDGIKWERIAILKEYRKIRAGWNILKNLFMISQEYSEKRIYLFAQLEVIPFYEKFGFKSFGEIFLDADIEHKKMEMFKNG
jgi:predicted GNAT family N-acyltransferase